MLMQSLLNRPSFTNVYPTLPTQSNKDIESVSNEIVNRVLRNDDINYNF